MFDDEWTVPPSERSDADLIATLDDVVQALCRKSHEEWANDDSTEHRYFTALKTELSTRLSKQS